MPNTHSRALVGAMDLTEADQQRITLGKWFNDSLINATQKLLRKKFPKLMRKGYKTQ